MVKKLLCVAFLFAATLSIYAKEALTSPDGKYTFTFNKQGDRLCYRLDYAGKQVVGESELGIDIDNHLVENAMGVQGDSARAFTAGMKLQSVDRSKRDTVWNTVYGEADKVRDHYNEMTLHFVKTGADEASTGGYVRKKEYLLDIEVRAYNEGVAFRYSFPEATNGLFMHITRELTTFAFQPGTVAYHAAWAQAQYNKLPLSSWKEESERPLLLETPNGLYVSLLEANLYDYARGKFKLKSDNVLQVSMYDTTDIITPYNAPWRVIMVGERAVDLINNNSIVLNLNEPNKITDTSWIRPGKAFRINRLDQQSALKGIDFAVDRNIQYILLDAGWYGPEMKVSSSALAVAANRDLDIPALCSYARSKGVGVWLYVNQRALYQQLDSIVPLYKKWGVSGIKFGFVQVGSQRWTTWMHNAVKKCAEYNLMVDIHDEYRPTGWSRTYPNLLTQEGIGGNEEMPDARHNTILPFTRFLCGPADYTLCYFNGRVKNTKAHQLAMAVVYYSPLTLLYWYDNAELYRGERELEFWKECPTVWNESIALDGKPGEYIVEARRSGNDWFVGAMTGLDGRTITIDTKLFLNKGKKYKVEIYNDDPTLKTRTNVSSVVTDVKAGKKLQLTLQPKGGAALRFVEK